MLLRASCNSSGKLACIGSLLLGVRQDDLATMPVRLLIVDLTMDGIDAATVRLGTAREDGTCCSVCSS